MARKTDSKPPGEDSAEVAEVPVEAETDDAGAADVVSD